MEDKSAVIYATHLQQEAYDWDGKPSVDLVEQRKKLIRPRAGGIRLPPHCCSIRYFMYFMVIFCGILIMATKNNLSMTIISMTYLPDGAKDTKVSYFMIFLIYFYIK